MGLLLLGFLLVLAVPAHAQGTQTGTEVLNVTWPDGGHATGYVVYTIEQPRFPWEIWPTVSVQTWSVIVAGGNEAAFPPALYVPATGTATASYYFGVTITFSLNGQERAMSYKANGLPLEVNGASFRQASDSGWTAVTPPIVLLTVNGERPASRAVATATDFVLTVQMAPAGVTTPLDWYWAIAVNDVVYWVTASGLSLTPAPAFHGPPEEVQFATVPFQAAPGTRITNFLAAVDSSGVVSSDTITAVVGSSVVAVRKH